MESGSPFLLIDVLQRHKVPIVIIGGHAVTYHGYVRATEDLDVVFQRSPQSESALLSALTEVNAHWISDEIDPDTGIEKTRPVDLRYIAGNRLMMMVTDFGFLDIFDYVPGLPSLSVQTLFDSVEVCEGRPYVSLLWLRRMKSASGRSKDAFDLEQLPDEG